MIVSRMIPMNISTSLKGLRRIIPAGQALWKLLDMPSRRRLAEKVWCKNELLSMVLVEAAKLNFAASTLNSIVKSRLILDKTYDAEGS